MDTPWLKVFDELGITAPPFDDRPLGQVISDHARNIPDSRALIYFSKSFSYAEYDREANRLAHALHSIGVGRGDVVGLHMFNTPQYAFALAALSKLGAIGSGVSPLLAPPELAYQINDSGVKALLTLDDLRAGIENMTRPKCLETIVTSHTHDYLAPKDVKAVTLKGAKAITYQDLIRNAPTDPIQVSTHWDDTFMIQYTGGTTGNPKGAQLSQRNIMHNPVMVGAVTPPAVPGQEIAATAFPLFHIAGLSFLVSSAIEGASFFLFPNPRDTDTICQTLKRIPPTRLALVPALYDMLLAHPEFKTIDFSRLEIARMGGAPMTSTTYNALKSVLGAGKISDVFGMTETSPCYINHPPTRYKPGSVGIPCAGASVRIRDVETGTRDMPIGEIGEVCAAGPQVMKGYLNLPDESARALREIDGQTWMFSGDVGYLDDEGYLYLCDRAKDMLIVGGFKVFSVEVEDKLQTRPEVGTCAIIGTADEKRPGNDIVNLYVQLAPDFKDTPPETIKSDLTTFCRETMAPYKVPKHIHIIDEIPLTPVGKIDKKALRH